MAAPGCCRLGGREAGGERWRAQRKSLQIAPPKPIENRTGGRDAGNDGHQASWGAEGDQIMRLSPYMGQLRGEDMLVGGGGGVAVAGTGRPRGVDRPRVGRTSNWEARGENRAPNE